MADPTERLRGRPPQRAAPPSRPVVLLPAARAGGPPRRFVIDPSRVFALLAAVFLLGIAVTCALLLPLHATRRASLVADRDAWATRYEELAARVEEIEARWATTAPTKEAPGIDADSAPTLRLTPPTAPVENLRVAALRSKGPLTLQGEALLIVDGPGQATPLPEGSLVVRVLGAAVSIEGVGTRDSGVRVENRLGPVRIGDRSYAGAVELHVEDSGLLVINELDLEKYLQGVVGGEVPAGWPLEAKKAQAVVARTYALVQRAAASGPYDLEATTADQVYTGTAADGSTRAAVTATHGEVLLQDGLLVTSYFSSACGGTTESPAEVWPERSAHGNTVVACGACEDSPYERWSLDLEPREIAEALNRGGHAVTEVTGLHIKERSASDRVHRLEVVADGRTISMSGQDFRALLGFVRLKSAAFTVEVAGSAFRLVGTGFGHGVGLCQHGARGLDRAGKGYRDILTHYFPSAHTAKIY